MTWRAAWASWRNKRLLDPRFQRFAADFPLFKGIARRSTAELFDLVAGFVYSQVLAACVRLGVLQALRAGPRDAESLAASLDLPPASMERLLRAAAALELTEPVGDGRYALGRHGAALLGNAGLVEMITHHAALYADLGDPVALLRQERGAALAEYWPYATTSAPAVAEAEAVSAYSALMAATQPAVAADVLDSYSMRAHRLVMDVGGGEGAFLEAAGQRWAHLELRLFDLPAVTERARERFKRAGLSARATVIAGDFLNDPLPAGADLITLVRVLHDHDDEGCARLLRGICAALPKGGRLLIAEPMSAAPTPDPVCDAYFGFYLMAMGRGRARTPQEIQEALKQAGFAGSKLLHSRTPMLRRIILATV